MVWLPFELHPEVPPEGMPREELLPPAYRERVRAGVRAMAAEEGLVMKSSERLINSRLALATAEFAREQGEAAFGAIHRALFKAHWERSAELDSIPDLVRMGAAAGLEGPALEAALRAGRYAEVLDANRREASTLGISAIPAHIFGRRFLVLGAQPESVFRQVLADLSEPGSAGDTGEAE